MQKQEILEYVADTADQLAALVREYSKAIAAALEFAAELARDEHGDAASPQKAARSFWPKTLPTSLRAIESQSM